MYNLSNRRRDKILNIFFLFNKSYHVRGDIHTQVFTQNVSLTLCFKPTHPQWKRQPWQSKTASRNSASCLICQGKHVKLGWLQLESRVNTGKRKSRRTMQRRGGRGALECNLTGRCPFFKSLHNPFRKKICILIPCFGIFR